MAKTFLCTTGTSIANGCPSLPTFLKRATLWDDDTELLSGEMQERLKGIDLTTGAGQARASAELNALHRVGLRQDDEVVLFVTDTGDGRCCAESLKQVLHDCLGVRHVHLERIEGLQVRDAKKLREIGLANLSRRLVHYLDDPQRKYGGGCVLCPNGGFKGVVPFMTVLGMLFHAPVVYVFEFAEALIKLPPLPVGFSADLFDRAMPALKWGRDQGVFDPVSFYRLISGFAAEEEDAFGSFLEINSGEDGPQMAALSPLAEVLVEREAQGELTILLSVEAKKSLENLTGPAQAEAESHLRKLTSAQWRSQHKDTKYNNDLDFYPRGRNPWRFAGFVKENAFHVCWFTNQKKEYESLIPLPSRQRAAYEPHNFITHSFSNAEIVAEVAAEDPDYLTTWQAMREERNEACEIADSCSKELGELKQANANLRKEKEAISKQLKQAVAKKPTAKKPTIKSVKPLPENVIPKGTRISAHWHASRKHSTVFLFADANNQESTVMVAGHQAEPANAGQPFDLQITGFDGTNYQAILCK